MLIGRIQPYAYAAALRVVRDAVLQDIPYHPPEQALIALNGRLFGLLFDFHLVGIPRFRACVDRICHRLADDFRGLRFRLMQGLHVVF